MARHLRRVLFVAIVLVSAAGGQGSLAIHASNADGAVQQTRPSIADLFAGYIAWVRGVGPAGALAEPDLDAARADLERLAPAFLVPLEGTMTDLRGRCPTVTFRISGVTVSSDANTRFEEKTCDQLIEGRDARVFRPPNVLRPVSRVISIPRDRNRPRPSVDDGQRRLLVTFALELAATSAIRQSSAAARLVEWACDLERAHTPPSDFDRAWQLAALAVLEGGIDARALDAHLSHLGATLDDEPRVVLARAIVEEQSTAPAETLSGTSGAVDAARASYLQARTAEDHTEATGRAITLFREAARDDTLHDEASIRLAHVQIAAARGAEALRSLATVSAAPDDLALSYLADLFRGLAYDGLGRSADARAAYLGALSLSPGAHSATMRLAALEFRDGERESANQLIAALLADDNPQRDPWWSYYAGDWRFWYPRIDRVRALLKATPSTSAPPAHPAPRANPWTAFDRTPPRATITPARWQQPVFRSRADAVTIPVSVKTGNKAVAGLTAADFDLRDQGVRQDITTVSVERVPLDLTILLDLSSSVDGTTLQRLKAAVRDTDALLRAGDRVRLISVSQVLHEAFGLQPRGTAMPLDGLAAEGATALYDGLAAAMMRPTEADRRQLILAFTDGRDSTSIIDEPTARELARLTDTVVDIVVPIGGPGEPGSAPIDPNVLPPLYPGQSVTRTPIVRGSPSELAARAQALKPWASRGDASRILADVVAPTSGQVFTIGPGESVSAAFRRMLDDFRTTYVLQYSPKDVTRGGWHDVTVTLTRRGKYEIRARNGYSGGPLDAPTTGSPARNGWSTINRSEPNQ